ncbi:DUF3347 domain-containing protein [Pedobacter miscanthi]|jgi:hypothetical protein|uniref:DUF3347 domain-containing protein n=1 Tax=Pedobacter miscanthi TaxID=2259170 RepID=UPI00292EDC0D|nr:DUF3347 domain-containing protein [Pedobacter miscanthi]
MKTFLYGLAFSLFFLNTYSSNAAEKQANNLIVDQEPKNSATAIIDAYLKLKNALSTDNGKNASAAGNELVKAFKDFDQSKLTPAQRKTYTNIESDAKEHAEHIGLNAGKIAHQREHFDMLSKDIYDISKLLGTDREIYVDRCPMYNKGKGAIWLSEVKEIKNPYFGKSMSTCGSIKETLH